jgi:hypothetical protein
MFTDNTRGRGVGAGIDSRVMPAFGKVPAEASGSFG